MLWRMYLGNKRRYSLGGKAIVRKPKIENKYNLKPKDIEKATILDYERLKQPPFWRNNVVKAWCLSGGSGKGFF